MIIYGQVNARLRENAYFRGVPASRTKPGSKQGQPKPLKRYLDARFPARLEQAMRAAKFVTPDGLDVPRLSREADCTRAVLHKYLGGTSKAIEALLLFRIADVLEVSPAWLLKAEGDPARRHTLTPDVRRSLEALLKTPVTR